MSSMLRPSDIAVLVETQLNEIAIDLFDNELIDDKVVFNVTADYQLYERMQKAEYELNDYQEFTPVIISRVDHYEYPADYLRYEERYTMGVYGYIDQLHSLETIFKAYTVAENTTNKSIVVAPFRITKEAIDITFGEEMEPMDGSMKKRVQGNGGFSWTFLDGIMTSYDTIVKIDDEEMPYISFDWGRSVDTLQTQVINNVGQTSNYTNVKNYAPVIVLPYVSTSDVIKSLYRELYDEVYNKSHTLSYYDTALDETFTYDVRIVGGSFSDKQPQVLEFGLVFEKILPTVSITIDDVLVPVINFELNSGALLSTTTKINSEVTKSAYLGVGYQLNISLDISDESNSKTQEILSQVISQSFGTPYTIVLTKGSLTATYDVLLNNGTYAFNANPVDKIDLVFVEVDTDV